MLGMLPHSNPSPPSEEEEDHADTLDTLRLDPKLVDADRTLDEKVHGAGSSSKRDVPARVRRGEGARSATVVMSREELQGALPNKAPPAPLNQTVLLATQKFSPRRSRPASDPAPSSAPTPRPRPTTPTLPSTPSPSAHPSTKPVVSTKPVATKPTSHAPREASRSSKRRIGLIVVAFVASAIIGAIATKASTTADARWVAPMVLSSSDPRVMQVAATLQEETAHRAALESQRKELESQLREYDASRSAVAKERERMIDLQRAMTSVDALLAEKDERIASIRRSPYGAALEGDVTLGFVAYENASQITPGDALFACGAGLLSCARVGTVGEILPGEARGTHPTGGRAVRGQLVRVLLTDAHANERPLLYAGQKPIF